MVLYMCIYYIKIKGFSLNNFFLIKISTQQLHHLDTVDYDPYKKYQNDFLFIN